jgi:hypothetical protein
MDKIDNAQVACILKGIDCFLLIFFNKCVIKLLGQLILYSWEYTKYIIYVYIINDDKWFSKLLPLTNLFFKFYLGTTDMFYCSNIKPLQ